MTRRIDEAKIRRVQTTVNETPEETRTLNGNGHEPPAESFDWASLFDVDTDPPPPREWVIPDWLPRGQVAGLFGTGGSGKSLLCQQIAVAVANGLPIFGQDCVQGPVVGIFSEDDNDELRRRHRSIIRSFGRSSEYSSDGLYLEGRSGKANALVTFGADRLPVTLSLFERLRVHCAEVRPALIIIDNIAQCFIGDELKRCETTAFCNLLTGLAEAGNSAIVLIGHTAKAQGSEYSGSSAWEAAMRTRLWLKRRETDGLLDLKRQKANYAGLGDVTLEYREGALVEVDSTGPEVDSEALAGAKELLRQALHTYTTRLTATSHVSTARTYLPTMAMRDGMLGDIDKRLAVRALNALIDSGEFMPQEDLGWRTHTRHPAKGLKAK